MLLFVNLQSLRDGVFFCAPHPIQEGGPPMSARPRWWHCFPGGRGGRRPARCHGADTRIH